MECHGTCSQALLGKFIIPRTESFGENFPGAHANGEEQNREMASESFLAGFGMKLITLLNAVKNRREQVPSLSVREAA